MEEIKKLFNDGALMSYQLVDKINELVDGYNELMEVFWKIHGELVENFSKSKVEVINLDDIVEDVVAGLRESILGDEEGEEEDEG